MRDNLRDLLPDNLSDETAYQLVNFCYELALSFESIYLGKIMRYQKSLIVSGYGKARRDKVPEKRKKEE